MRNELLNFENHFWGIQRDDIIYTAILSKSLFDGYMTTLENTENLSTHDFDIYFASHIREAQFALHFGIWRLQAVFETLLKTEFEIKTKMGLKKIIEILKTKGYTISSENELYNWTGLRNKISHVAPERFHPAPTNLRLNDIDEYSTLLLNIFDDLRKQANDRT